jgi:hypothetical protein
MSDEIETQDSSAPAVSRRESIRLAAAAALGTGLGAPAQLLAMPAVAGQLQVKFYKGLTDGGSLVGGVALNDTVTSFLATLAGASTQIKWYDPLGRELGAMGLPSTIQEKIRLAMPSGD